MGQTGLHRRAPVERHRMTKWHQKGSKTKPEGRPKSKVTIAARKALNVAKKTITVQNIRGAFTAMENFASKSDKVVYDMREKRGGRLFRF